MIVKCRNIREAFSLHLIIKHKVIILLKKIIKNPTVSIRIHVLFYLSILAISIFVSVGIENRYNAYQNYKQINENVRLISAISALIHEIQLERGLSSLYTDEKTKTSKQKYDKQKNIVDKKIKNLYKLTKDMSHKPWHINISKLKTTRNKIDNFSMSHEDIINFYTDINKKFLYQIFDQHSSREVLLYHNFLLLKDLMGVQRAVISHVLAKDSLSYEEKLKIGKLIIRTEVYSDFFINSIEFNVKQKYEDIINNQIQFSINETISDILKRDKFSDFDKSPNAWFKEMTNQINLLNNMEKKLSGEFIKANLEREKEAELEFIVYTIISVLLIVFLLIFKYFTSRSIRTSIRRLKTSKKRVQKGLDEIKNLNQEIEDTQKEVIFTMGAVVESRSKETINHVRRVAQYSKILALSYGLDEKEASLLKQASPMHDAGKAGIPDAILNKPAKLTSEEFEAMKEHAAMGYEIFKSSNREILKTAAIVAHEHHEKYNGSGYPRGLKGEDIHIYGRITAVADVFDALGSDRVYKKAWDDEKIFAYFKEQRGEHFDPKLVDIFFENLDKFLEVRKKFKD